MTLWRIDGFEHGVTATGTPGVYDQNPGAISIVTSPTRGGLRSLRVASVNAAARVGVNLPASTSIVSMGFAVQFTTADGFPAANAQVATFTNASGNGQLRYINSTGRLQLSHASVNGVTVGPVLALDTWYWIDLYYDSSGASATLTGSVDGGASAISSRTQAAAFCTSVSLGTPANTETISVHYDDWVVEPITPVFPHTSHRVEGLVPTTDGTHNITTLGDFDSFTTTQFSNATTTAAAFLGHRPLQVANTADQVIRQELGTVANYMEFNLGNLAASTNVPVAARVYASHVESASGGASLGIAKLLLSTNVEVLTEGSLSAIDTTEDPGTVVSLRKRMAIDPSGGWDQTKVNGLKCRVGFADNAPDVNFIDFMVEVASTDTVFATPSKVSGVAAVATPTIAQGSTSQPATVAAQVSVPTPAIRMSATATPAKVSGVAAVPTPGIVAGGAATATPLKISAVAAVPTPDIDVSTPSSSFYSAGYGQGYETIIPEPPPAPPVIPVEPGTTPDLRVRIDFPTDINPPTGAVQEPQWVDISALLRSAQSVAIRRGRQRQLDRNEAGNVSMLFGDPDRLLDPDNIDGPYWPNILPDRRMQVQATFPDFSEAFTMNDSFVGDEDIVGGGNTFRYLTIWQGFTDEFQYAYPGPGKDSVVSIRGVDMLALASRQSVGTFLSGDETVADALNMILNYSAFTGRAEAATSASTLSSEDRDIASETGIVLQSKSYAGTMLEGLEEVAVSGGGNFFAARDGRPTYRNQIYPASTPIVLRMAVDAERYRDVEFTYDSQLIYNDILVTSAIASDYATATDATSQQRHPGRSRLEVATLLPAGLLQARADQLLATYREPERIISHLVIRAPDTDWGTVLRADLWDRVTVEVVLPNGDLLTQESVIQGIAIDTPHHRNWTVDWWLSLLPVVDLLSDEDKSFEGGTVGNWEAGTNCDISATNQEWASFSYRKGESTGYRYNSPPANILGQYALWADSIVAGVMDVGGPVIAIAPRNSYTFKVQVRNVRFDAANVQYANYTTRGPWRIEFDWLDSLGAVLSSDFGPDVSGANPGSGAWSQPVGLSLTKRAPNGAVYVQPRVAYRGTVGSGMFIDAASLYRTV